MHGGLMTTIIDEATTLGILANDRQNRLSVSVKLECVYLRSAGAGDTIYILINILKIGR